MAECDISGVHCLEDDEDRVWEEAGSDHGSQAPAISEHVWAADEEGEAGWHRGATLHRKHRYFPACFVSHQSTLHPSTFIVQTLSSVQ